MLYLPYPNLLMIDIGTFRQTKLDAGASDTALLDVGIANK